MDLFEKNQRSYTLLQYERIDLVSVFYAAKNV